MTIIVQDDHLTAEAWAACTNDSGIHKEMKDWNTGIQQKKGGICVVLIWRRPRVGPPFSSRFMDLITQVSSSSLFPAKR